MRWRVVLVVAASVVAVVALVVAVAVNPTLLWWVAAGLLVPVVVAAVQVLGDVVSKVAEYALVVALIAVVCIVAVGFLGSAPNSVPLDTEPAAFSVDAVLLEDDSGRKWNVTTRLTLEAADLDRALDALEADGGAGWAKMASEQRDEALRTIEPALAAAGYALERDRDTSVVFAARSTEPVGTIGMPPQHKLAADTTVRVDTPTVGELLFEPDDKSVVMLLTDCHAIVNVRPAADSTCVDGREEHVVSLDRGGPVESTQVTAKVVAPLLRYPGVNVAAVAPFQWWIGGAIALLIGAAGLAVKDVLKDWFKNLFKRSSGRSAGEAAEA